jgi:hypothetical protein
MTTPRVQCTSNLPTAHEPPAPPREPVARVRHSTSVDERQGLGQADHLENQCTTSR